MGEKLLIASEMKAFLAMGWTPEWDVESIMSFGQYHDDRTVFRGVEKVRGAFEQRMREIFVRRVNTIYGSFDPVIT